MRAFAATGCWLAMLAACERAPAVGVKIDRSVDPNPNGSSELSWLMRDMMAQGQVWRAAIQGGGELGRYPQNFDDLPTAPSTPSIKNDTFDPLAADFLRLTHELVGAPAAAQREAFDAWVNGCLACHATMCGGPVPAIEGLRL